MNAMDTERARFNMIEQQIRPWEVLDDRVLTVIARTPREAFVPDAYRGLAFADISIPLGHGQAMMPPKLEARLLQSLELNPDDDILEIGTGSGYLSACLARLGARVHSVDLFEDFIDTARARLDAHGIGNVTLDVRNAATGWQDERRFDAIAVTGSLPVLHRGFHDALSVGGRLFVIVGTPPVMEARLITRSSETEWCETRLFETSVPPLIDAPRPEAFRF